MNLIIKRSFIILPVLLLTQRVFSQAPSITYPTPPTLTVGTAIAPLSPTNSGGAVAVNGQTITLAGSTTAGFTNGTGTAATFNHPEGIAVDASGNVYVSDAYNSVIRKITPTGLVTTYAGSGTAGATNGPVSSATFHTPQGLAVDGAGNVYVADSYNNLIRKITPAGVVSTLAGNGTAGYVDGSSTTAEFNSPSACAVDASGNVYVTDNLNNRIRMVTPAGMVSTLAGSGSIGSANGTGAAATFHYPYGITVGPSGNIYVADWYNHMIRKITQAGVVTTVAGSTTAGFADGTGSSASFNYPVSIISDANENLYVADEHNHAVRMINLAGAVKTIAGTGTQGSANGIGSSATFYYPFGIATDATGYVYVAEYGNYMIRKVAVANYSITPGFTNGLIFNPTTGTIGGTPNTVSTATSYPITAYNMAGISSASPSITVNAAPVGSQGQSLNQNYEITNKPRISGIVNDSTMAANAGDKTKVQTAVQYVDGLGRPIQTIQKQASPLGYDMIQPAAYDQYGREITKYLPYTPQTGTAGSYRPTAVTTDQNAFYTAPPTGSGVGAITDPYSQTSLEASPLGRTLEQGAPGIPWQLSTSGITGSGHTVKIVYTINNATTWASDSVHSMQVANYYATINSNNSRNLVANGYYPAGSLSVTISKDENLVSGRAGTVEEYKDIDGRVVLKRAYNYTTVLQQLSTYYVYDDMGKLAFVLPPSSGADGAGTITQTTLNNLCYQYQYDERGRAIQKKIPGKGWEYMVYNTMDQPVASQDSLQRANKQWIFTKYDALGRTVMTGIWNNGGTAVTRASLQSTLNGITTNLYEAAVNSGNGYTNVAWPTSAVTATLTTNFYDTYANIPSLPATYTVTTGVSLLTRGMPTVKKTAVLNTPTDQLWDVMYYDDLGRSIKGYAQHYLGGTANTNNYDLITATYSFTNAPTTVTRQHWNTTSTTTPLVTIANTYIYDQIGRKLKSWEQITNGTTPTTKTLISQTDYNEIGQTVTKHLHSIDSLNFYQNVAYTYNERGWMLSSSAPLFAMTLYYNGIAGNKAYNGNIMYQYWGTPGNLTNIFNYAYDPLNRLMYGVQEIIPSGTITNTEQNITYDLQGNITHLTRLQAGATIDNMAYTYTSGGNPTNQLQSIADASGSNTGVINGTSNFTYDGNGNLTVDPSKPTGTINIAYNLLNLPQNITGAKTITYTYDAAGNKLRRNSVTSNNITDYISGIQYDGTTTPSLSFIQTEEGKAVPIPTGGYDYTYYLGDNLGNTRVTFDTKAGSAVQVQKDDYYPFGMEINSAVLSPKNEYLYNKKELQEELNEYDYGARFYDPVIARWNTIDPLAEKSRRFSPYVYVENNPIRMIDPDGMEGVKSDKDGKKTVESNVVVLLKQKKEVPKDATDKQKAKIEKQNARIERQNAGRLSDVSERLNEAYNGSDGKGTKNSAGEVVNFKFNIIGVETANTDGGSLTDIRKIATDNGLSTGEKDFSGNPVKALAAVVTTRSSGGNEGLSNGIFTSESFSAPRIALAHEIGHTFQLGDNYPSSTGGLMDYPPGGLIPKEVDEIWNKAHDK